MTLVCPFCDAKPGEDCRTSGSRFSAVHVARIKAAASIDKKTKDRADEAARQARAHA
jgi:hypothetical protein